MKKTAPVLHYDMVMEVLVVMVMFAITTDRFYYDLFLSKKYFIKILFTFKICSLVKKFKKDHIT